MKPKGFKKIESIRELERYGLPIPETIFVFDFKKQEKEIMDFLKDKNFVTIRSDKRGGADFCPCSVRCPRGKAGEFMRKVIKKGYAIVLQRYIPVKKNRILSGNILIFKRHLLMELMGLGPLTWLNRKGKLAEQIRFRKDNLQELGHRGKRLTSKNKLASVAKLLKKVPPYKILEFTLTKEGPFFWQIKEDRTAEKLE